MDERTAKLTLKNISKTFYDRQGEHPTIADVSFEVYDNEFLVILGPGLCGKTVLLNAVAGLERGGHDFEPAKFAVSKLGLGLKRRSPLRLRPISPLSPPPLRQLLLSILKGDLSRC